MVMDASALLAYWRDEPGSDVVEEAFDKPMTISSVTWVEVVGKLVGMGEPLNQVERDLEELELEVVPFDQEQARIAAFFYARRKPYNLAFGDCATLALGEYLEQTILTAEQHWAKLPNLRVKIKLIR